MLQKLLQLEFGERTSLMHLRELANNLEPAMLGSVSNSFRY